MELLFKGLSVKEIMAQLWVWINAGFAPASIALGLVSDLMIGILWMKNIYGISIAWWESAFIIIIGILSLTLLGYIWYKTKFQEYILTYMNTQGNKQNVDAFKYYEEIKKGNEEIKKILERNGMK